MSNETRNGYQFTIDSATNTVTAVAEVKNGEFRFEAIDSQESWTFDPATNTVTRTDGEPGNLEITTFTDIDGDGIFVHASTDPVLPPIVICPAPFPIPVATDPVLTITTKPIQPVKPAASQDGYKFTIDGTTNAITAVYEVKKGVAKPQEIDSHVTFAFDAASGTVTKTEIDHGMAETIVYSDLDGDGIFAKASKSYASANGATQLSWDARHVGGDSDDHFKGGSGHDYYAGGLGNDQLDGGAGDDDLYGGDGADQLAGGDGGDIISGGTGADKLDGGIGNDSLDGGADNDTLIGGTGTDQLDGGTGNDSLTGGDGTDSISGGDGSDQLDGGTGNDSLAGGAGTDSLSGGTGADQLDGGIGNDSLNGGADNDNIIGADGTDSLIGGAGADTLDGGTGNDSLNGGAGGDTIIGGAGTDSLNGGDGGDVVFGGLGKDVLLGGAGNDVFKYSNISDSGISVTTRDVITDFTAGDKIDLSAIDAKAGFTANDAFTFIGGAADLTLAKANGAVWFDHGVIYASTDKDLAAEFQIELTGVTHVTAADFVL